MVQAKSRHGTRRMDLGGKADISRVVGGRASMSAIEDPLTFGPYAIAHGRPSELRKHPPNPIASLVISTGIDHIAGLLPLDFEERLYDRGSIGIRKGSEQIPIGRIRYNLKRFVIRVVGPPRVHFGNLARRFSRGLLVVERNPWYGHSAV